MRILQYNVLDGCENDPERLGRLGAWLRAQAADVVGLNELNGWDAPPCIAARAAEWGYTAAELNVTGRSDYFVGVLARHPVTPVGKREVGFAHGLLHVRICGVHFLITHLTPGRAADRENEAAIVAEIVGPITEPLVLMGDLNTLSPLDRDLHERGNLRELLQSDAGLRSKFLNAAGDINYTPMQRLLDAGLTDLGADVPVRHTVPTAVNTDKMHAAPMRLDYMLANAAFAESAGPARPLHSADTDRLSDHYPVGCQFGAEQGRGHVAG